MLHIFEHHNFSLSGISFIKWPQSFFLFLTLCFVIFSPSIYTCNRSHRLFLSLSKKTIASRRCQLTFHKFRTHTYPNHTHTHRQTYTYQNTRLSHVKIYSRFITQCHMCTDIGCSLIPINQIKKNQVTHIKQIHFIRIHFLLIYWTI